MLALYAQQLYLVIPIKTKNKIKAPPQNKPICFLVSFLLTMEVNIDGRSNPITKHTNETKNKKKNKVDIFLYLLIFIS